jgi:hypothetical protein
MKAVAKFLLGVVALGCLFVLAATLLFGCGTINRYPGADGGPLLTTNGVPVHLDMGGGPGQ